jgi:hypothetical protein
MTTHPTENAESRPESRSEGPGRTGSASRLDFPGFGAHLDISLAEQLALKVASQPLARDFAGIHGAETIDRFLASSYDEFADRATLVDFHPLPAEPNLASHATT